MDVVPEEVLGVVVDVVSEEVLEVPVEVLPGVVGEIPVDAVDVPEVLPWDAVPGVVDGPDEEGWDLVREF